MEWNGMEMEWNGMVMHVCMYIAYDVRYRFRDAYGITLIWQKKEEHVGKQTETKGETEPNRAMEILILIRCII
jgi:hypothetical protein